MTKYKNIFTITNYPLQYVDLSAYEVPNSYYGCVMFIKFGERNIAPFVENMLVDGDISEESIRLIGNIIETKYKPLWDKVFDTLNIEYNPIADYRMTGTENVESTGTLSDNQSENMLNKTATFDTQTDDYVDNSKTNTTTTQTQNNEGTRDTVYTREGITGKIPVQEYIKKEIDLRKFTIADIIIKDTIDFITLSIY